MRSLETLFALAAAAALAACGGGGGSAPAPANATAPTPAPTPAPAPVQGVRVAGMKLSQALLFPSDDGALVLVAGKNTYVQVDVTAATASAAAPRGVLHVQDATGAAVADVALTAPTGEIPTSVPARPGPASSYHALLPSRYVKPGLRLQAALANGASATIAPAVGGGVSIRLVQVPMRIGTSTGVVVAGGAPHVLARMPLAGVTAVAHAAYASTGVPELPATDDAWSDAFSTLLGELADLQSLEGAAATDYYAGFVPKETSGIVGLGYTPGRAVVVADWIGYDEQVRGFLTHELGHNMSLQHAPCGVTDADPSYPYANGTLGGPGRYIWGYLPATSTWIDATDASQHDVMSYCDGATFSDYNWRLIQQHLAQAREATATRASADAAPQELVLASGEIRDGRATLRPLKTLRGQPTPAGGPYTLRLVTAAGAVDTPFDARALDHDAGRLHFGVAVARPGKVLGAQVLKDGVVLAHLEAHPRAERLEQSAAALAPVRASEAGGRLRLAWDAGRWPYLSVTWTGAGRQVLAQDLRGGAASLPLDGLAAGGAFEFSLSDGLDTLRVAQPR